MVFDKNKKNNLNSAISTCDDEETNDIDEEFNVLNDEGDGKKENIKNIKYFSITRPNVKTYFENYKF